MNFKLDTKAIIIIVLLVVVVLSFVFRPSKPIEKYETEIGYLKKENVDLVNTNKILTNQFDSVSKVISVIEGDIKMSESKLDSANKVIDKLKKKRLAIPAHVDTLKASEIVTEYDEYFKRKAGKK